MNTPDATIARMQQLEHAIRRMEAILNFSSDALMLVDVHDGIQQVNFAFCECFACDQDTYFGQLLDRLIDPSDVPQLEQVLSRVISNQPTIQPFEVRALRADKTEFDAEITLALVRSLAEEDHLVVCTIRDITRRKHVEQSRAAAEQRYRGLFEQSNDGVILLDEFGKHILANQRAAEMFGYTVAELQALGVEDLVEDPETSWRVIDELMQGRHIPPYLRRFRKKNGEGFPVEINVEVVHDSQGNFSHIQSVLRDLSNVQRMERIIREKDEDLERFFTSSLELLSIASIEDGMFIRANVMWQEVMGYDPKALEGTPMLDIVHLDDIQKTVLAIEQLRRDGMVPHFVNRCRHHDGSYRSLEWRVVLHEDLIYAAARDITAQLATIESLHQSEQWLKATLAAIPDMVFRNDLEGTYLGYHGPVNDSLITSPDHFIGKKARDVLPPDIAEIADRAIREAHRANKPHAYEYSLSLPGGTRDFEARIAPINDSEVLTIVRDVTEQRQMDRDLRESEARFRQIADNTNQVLYVQALDGSVLYVSKAYETIFGQSCQSVYADHTSVRQSVHPDDVVLWPDHDELVQRVARGEVRIEYRIVRPDGTMRWLRDRNFPVNDEAGQMIRIVGIIEDITGQKEHEVMLQSTLDKEREVSDLKSRFVSMASHEFRTPLAAILATAETLKVYRDRLDAGQIDHRLDKIRRQVRYMQQVMDNLLTIARAQAGKIEFSPKPEDLDIICQDIIEELHSQPGFEGRIRYECPRVPVIAVVDERMMRQIVSNLLSNALKYSTAEVRLSLSFDDEQTTIQVVDRGIGIPPEELESVGQPFHRAQNVGTISGTGLGLSITRQAVQAHGGELQITSGVGIGTTCLVILPNRQHGDVQ